MITSHVVTLVMASNSYDTDASDPTHSHHGKSYPAPSLRPRCLRTHLSAPSLRCAKVHHVLLSSTSTSLLARRPSELSRRRLLSCAGPLGGEGESGGLSGAIHPRRDLQTVAGRQQRYSQPRRRRPPLHHGRRRDAAVLPHCRLSRHVDPPSRPPPL
jgi:hypothetical protein